ncbi:MAG: hypothetical protein U0892_02420 [Pirellulales bacterium]
MSSESPSSSAAAKPAVEVMKLRLAAQYASPRERHLLDQLADQVEVNHDFDEAVRSMSWRSAPALKPMLEQAIAAGAPGDIVLRILQHDSKIASPSRQLLSVLTYPALLLTASILLVKVLQVTSINRESFIWFEEFQLKGYENFSKLLADFDNFVNGVFITLIWSAIMIVTIRLAASPLTRLRVLIRLPLIGHNIRLLALSRLVNRISVFLLHSPDAQTALERTAAAFESEALGDVASYVADRNEQGAYLGYTIHQTLLSDQRAGLVLAAADVPEGSLSERLRQAASTFAVMSELLESRLRVFLPVIMLVLLVGIVGNAVSVYFTAISALMRLITSLS